MSVGITSSQAFVPNKVTGLKLWVDSSDEFFTTSAGGQVSQWSDKSVSNNHLIQATVSRQPFLENDNALFFDGIDDFLKAVPFALVQPESVYILFKQRFHITGNSVFDGEGGSSGVLRQGNTSPELGAFAGVVLGELDTLPINFYGVVSVLFNSISSVLQLDNEAPLLGNTGVSNMNGFTLAARGNQSFFGIMQVKEIVVYNTAHDAAQRKEVVDYLIAKKTPFVPGDFINLEMEMDSLEPGPDTIISGGFISQWGDKSANGNHLIQTTGSKQPSVEPDGSILFDGVDDAMKAVPFTLNQPTTVYILFRQVTFIGATGVFDGELTNDGVLVTGAFAPELSIFAGTLLGPLTTLPIGNYGVITSVFDGASSSLSLNKDAAILGDSGTRDMDGLTLGSKGSGASFFGNIQVKALLVYSEAHTTNQIKVVVDYLNNRYP